MLIQKVPITALRLEVSFEAGEGIRMEISYKFTLKSVAEEFEEAGLRLIEFYVDDDFDFDDDFDIDFDDGDLDVLEFEGSDITIAPAASGSRTQTIEQAAAVGVNS